MINSSVGPEALQKKKKERRKGGGEGKKETKQNKRDAARTARGGWMFRGL